jgi:hypothetical protein
MCTEAMHPRQHRDEKEIEVFLLRSSSGSAQRSNSFSIHMIQVSRLLFFVFA